MRNPVPVRSRRGRRTLASLAVLAAVAGAVPVLGTPAHAAEAPLPWSAGTEIPTDNDGYRVRDLVIAEDGSSVALWSEYGNAVGHTTERVYYTAVRPAAGGAWGTPHRLGVSVGGPRLDGRLVDAKLAVARGQVVVFWWENPYDDATWDGKDLPTRLLSATLTGGTWSTAQTVLGAEANRQVGTLDLAAGTDGTVVATWLERSVDSAEWGVAAAVRSPVGHWTAPAPVGQDAATDGFNVTPEAAVDARGTAVVAFRRNEQDGGTSIRTATRAAGAADWSPPLAVATSPARLGQPRLASGEAGDLALTWSEGDPDAGDQTVHTATAAAAAEDWHETRPLVAGQQLTQTPDPIVEAGRNVTLIWVTRKEYELRTSTLDRADGTWSAGRTLSTGWTANAYDHDLGPDGTLRVLWTQEGALRQATRMNGVWTPAAPLWNSAAMFSEGRIAAGAGGRATAVWSTSTEGVRDRLMSSQPTAEPLKVVKTEVPTANEVYRSSYLKWTFNRGLASWTLTLTDATGAVLRTYKGGEALTVSALWNRRRPDRTYAPNGPVRWSLTAVPDGEPSAAPFRASGSFMITEGGAVFRDHGGASGAPDGTGDALVMTATGGLRSIYGDRATGKYKGSATGYGWPKGSLPVPIKDMNADRCNDVLVRNSKGELRRYTPACGKPADPTTLHRFIGSGWNQYDVLTSPGDVTGDTRADLVARNRTTGALYLYERLQEGSFAPRVQIPGTYKGYRKVVGAGDLNGDGNGDLLLQDTANRLWRMNGTGAGRFTAPVKLADAWGASYDALVAAGDMTGDGRADVVARDTSGRIWRYSGTGRGTFGARVLIATGWQVYPRMV
ncbi:FG-GAP repeat domain-containing protein [Streptomyces sp. NPDC101118]|uniref:FG-GAP repeat domain-containing protein n=1 Tax=Streptomyces sp. NPDC101118 TaxID=3366109 RepID=UPI0038064750